MTRIELAPEGRLRRRLLAGAAASGALAMMPARLIAAAIGSTADLGFTELPDGTLAEQSLQALPGKVPLIRKTARPPNFETPIEYFRTPITRNDAFFVRWHLSVIPEIDAQSWALTVGGESAQRERKFTLAELTREFEPAEVTAVCQCSGNRRGLFEPHVPGVQWGVGAMGNARWRGVRVKDVLAKVGVKTDAVEAVFDGADRGALDGIPDFVKSLPIETALDPETLIAFEMNGVPLPAMNGYPARLVVPGWTGTYWVKSLVGIRVVPTPESGFWMSTAYRLPRGKFRTPSFKSQVKEANEPITTMVVNSLITSLNAGQRIERGRAIDLRGIAWDGGSGIAKVEVSVDGGTTWREASLGTDAGRYSFREFALSVPARETGTRIVTARATNRAGETQVGELIANPAGYHHNVPQRIPIQVV
jgi:DMSO/TMAO reductase YedYZ molybdopterin-dependent catalytic subunit